MSDNELSLSELANAEIIPDAGGSNSYLVKDDNGTLHLVNRTPRNKLLLESDLLDQSVSGSAEFDAGMGGVVFLSANLEKDSFELRLEGDGSVSVPDRLVDDVINAAADGDGQGLLDTYKNLKENRVRVGLMDRFMPRFQEARENDKLKKTDDGWLINDTFILQWNGENYLTQGDTFERDGDQAVKADETRQAREFQFNAPSSAKVRAPDGQMIELSKGEVEFLASAELLVRPNADRSGNTDTIHEVATDARVTGFTDETDGLYHSHGLQKHRLQDLGVTDDTCEKLHHRSDGHSGVHELAARRKEFENAEFEVFTDAPNDDSSKWQKIENTRRNAPIPSDTQDRLRSMFPHTY